jgi:hypothetical protein
MAVAVAVRGSDAEVAAVCAVGSALVAAAVTLTVRAQRGRAALLRRKREVAERDVG